MNVQQEIDARNKTFRAASKQQKRILIAQDVLDQIKAQRIIPISGKWVSTNWANSTLFAEGGGNKSFRESYLKGDVSNCECCALGSMMTSCTLYRNKVKNNEVSFKLDYGDIIDDPSLDDIGITRVFSRQQLALIEIAFELGNGAYSYNKEDAKVYGYNPVDYVNLSEAKVQQALAFGKRFRSERNRLVGIMKNIIKNQGTFIPGN